MTYRISLFDISMLIKITEIDFLKKCNYIFIEYKHIGAYMLKLIVFYFYYFYFRTSQD